jgi:predicted amidophosphoribosyltransferase
MVDALVPVPLHARKLRARGFNQAEILARLLGHEGQIPVRTDVLRRRRNTSQQAKITSDTERRRNLAASFAGQPPTCDPEDGPEGGNRVGLVDDLVTSGWTVAAATESLSAAGWEVRWVVTLGLAGNTKNQGRCVDTLQGGF